MKLRELIVHFLRNLASYEFHPDKSDYFDKASRNPYEENARNKSAFNGVPSGFMALDRVTMGWQPSDLIIIAARPSMGKTAFALSMTRNITIDYHKPVWLLLARNERTTIGNSFVSCRIGTRFMRSAQRTTVSRSKEASGNLVPDQRPALHRRHPCAEHHRAPI